LSSDLKRAVMDAYAKIAEDYDRFRKKPFKEVELFLLKSRNLVLDIGTGNGRNLLVCPDGFRKAVGLDLCRSMLDIARRNLSEHGLLGRTDLIVADAAYLPFVNDAFEACINTAVLHHVSNSEFEKAVNEAVRVLKNGGELLCSVWDRKEIENRASGKEGECYIVKWGDVKRFFTAYDIEDLRRVAKLHVISNVFKAHPNCYIWIRKHKKNDAV
jgi:ubiquinone/menaquinone biosynthesis C-methylase UbiE